MPEVPKFVLRAEESTIESDCGFSVTVSAHAGAASSAWKAKATSVAPTTPKRTARLRTILARIMVQEFTDIP